VATVAADGSAVTAPGRADLGAAIRAWREAIGEPNVAVDEERLARAATATFPTEARVLALLRPADRAEVQACVRIANACSVPVYPVSRGRNWGLGSRAPVQDAAVLELDRLDRIVAFDEELAYVTVEPGVTFEALYRMLRARGSSLASSATGGPPDASLVGNALERGHGFGPGAERWLHACALEVVLPTGELLRTGLGRHPGARAARLHRSGSGPWLDGLFSQSSLGIVTEMTIWLARRAADFTMLNFELEAGEGFAAAVAALRELCHDPRFDLQLQGYYKVLARARRTGRAAAHEPAERDRLWGFAALHARNADEGRALRRSVRRALGGKVQALRVGSPALRAVGRALRRPLALAGVRLGAQTLDPESTSVWAGVPSWDGVRSMYAARGGPQPGPDADLDLDRDRCGLRWCCPVIPFTAADVRAMLSLAHEVALPCGLEPQLAFRPVGPRAIDVVIALPYDRREPGADEGARDCHRLLCRRTLEAGYPPYRLDVASMHLSSEGADEYARVLGALKRALDPNDVLAPGRYDGRRA
jgi:4-cresol dehydrogenase (hydroxylating)